MTINKILVLTKMVRERLSELRNLRSQVAVKETYYATTQPQVKEPQYDVKAVDKKIVELENFLFLADAAVKEANAKTEVDIEVKVEELLAPLQ